MEVNDCFDLIERIATLDPIGHDHHRCMFCRPQHDTAEWLEFDGPVDDELIEIIYLHRPDCIWMQTLTLVRGSAVIDLIGEWGDAWYYANAYQIPLDDAYKQRIGRK